VRSDRPPRKFLALAGDQPAFVAEIEEGLVVLHLLLLDLVELFVAPLGIDGLVLAAETTTGAHWPEGTPIPMDVVNAYNQTSDPLDGIAKLSAEWILKNMPELENVKFTMNGSVCMSHAIVVAAQAVGDGLAHTCLVLKSWHNLDGR